MRTYFKFFTAALAVSIFAGCCEPTPEVEECVKCAVDDCIDCYDAVAKCLKCKDDKVPEEGKCP